MYELFLWCVSTALVLLRPSYQTLVNRKDKFAAYQVIYSKVAYIGDVDAEQVPASLS